MADEATLKIEARRLRDLIDRTEDAESLNQLWSKFYAIADRLFPEALEQRKLFRSLEGAERERQKGEYVRLVRSLWIAAEEDSIPFVEVDELSEMLASEVASSLWSWRECQAIWLVSYRARARGHSRLYPSVLGVP